MSDLPQGWALAAVTDLIGSDGVFSDGDWVESKDQDPNGSIRLLQLADIGDGVFLDKSNRFINEFKFKELRCTEVLEGDVLLARMPDPLGRACLAPKLKQRSVTVVDVAILRSGTRVVCAPWLMHVLNSPDIRNEMLRESSGTTRRRIARGKLAQIELPVAPYNEQKRIADKLDAVLARVDACRERLDRIPAILKRFRQSVLAAATSGKLTEEWRKTVTTKSSGHDLLRQIRVDHAAYKNRDRSPKEKKGTSRSMAIHEPDLAYEGAEELYELPATWAWGSGAEVVEPGADIVYGIVQPGPKLDKGIPYVRGMDIENGRIAVGQLLKTSKDIAERYARSALKGGDILLGIIRATKVAVVPNELLGANITQGTARYRPSFCISTEYLATVLEAPATQAWLRAHYRGIDMPGLNLADVRRVPVPLPPLEEQAEICRRVSELFSRADRIEAHYAKARGASDRLTPALLAKAFRGELVPQDQDDEPAGVLLGRLRDSMIVGRKDQRRLSKMN